MPDLIFHNARLKELSATRPYSRADVDALAQELDARDPADVMQQPHVRFDGATLTDADDVPEPMVLRAVTLHEYGRPSLVRPVTIIGELVPSWLTVLGPVQVITHTFASNGVVRSTFSGQDITVADQR